MARLNAGTSVAGSVVWHAGNDGAGSGLDADTLDGAQLVDLPNIFYGTGAPPASGMKAGDIYCQHA